MKMDSGINRFTKECKERLIFVLKSNIRQSKAAHPWPTSTYWVCRACQVGGILVGIVCLTALWKTAIVCKLKIRRGKAQNVW